MYNKEECIDSATQLFKYTSFIRLFHPELNLCNGDPKGYTLVASVLGIELALWKVGDFYFHVALPIK